jgi:hypothetical protein
MIHTEVGHQVVVSGQAHMVPAAVTFAVAAGVPLIIHLVRAVRLRDASAVGWLRRRGLADDPRCVELTLQYLLRLRWSRVISTVVMLVVCGVAILLSSTWVSFVSLPILLSVLVAEALAPDPRRGRLRTASLDRRARSFFAPLMPLRLARACIGAAALLSFVSAALETFPHVSAPLTHGAVMVAGGLALEACLRSVSTRALPDRNPDLALDTAMRVASARTASAAALVFGVLGLFLAVSFAQFSLGHAGTWRYVLGQLMGLSVLAAVGVAIALVQPLTSWRPRGAR